MKCLNSAILYQNEEKTTTIIDIPTSITLAQVIPGQSPKRILLSTSPRKEPYPSIEPKSEKARAHVVARMGSGTGTCHHTDSIHQELQKAKQGYSSDWCLPRRLLPFVAKRQSKKRKIGVGESTDAASMSMEEPDLKLMPTRSIKARDNGWTATLAGLETVAEHTRMLTVIGSITDGGAAYFRRKLPIIYPNPSSSAGPRQFDFILLDPPWQSKSVSRSKNYQTVRDLNSIPIVSETLRDSLAPEALIGCWITNNVPSRVTALEAFFDAWNVKLIEEWVWVKTTLDGQPVYGIDGLWRKPYEVLLLGRKCSSEASVSGLAEENRAFDDQRRLMFGVPDLHSRKPCLKELIEPLMPNPTAYRAIEVFARNMTSGWLAWGDEAMKFNWKGHWSHFEDLKESNTLGNDQ